MSDIAALLAPGVSLDAIESVRHAIAAGNALVDIAMCVPADVAEKVLTLLTLERTSGALVVPARQEFTPAEAAVVVGASRQTIVRAIDAGQLVAHKVGSHWRIKAADVAAFVERARAERKQAAARLARATVESA